jgi:hypothetical protein
MSAEVQRKPALQRRVDPVAAAIPDRVHVGETTSIAAAAPLAREPLNTSLQVRVRASTRERLDEAVRKLQYERRDRSISLASLTDQALDIWLTQQGL